MKRSRLNEIQGVLVSAGRIDLAEVIASDLNVKGTEALDNKSNMAGRGVKKKKVTNKTEKELRTRQASSNPTKSVKKSGNGDKTGKLFNQSKREPK